MKTKQTPTRSRVTEDEQKDSATTVQGDRKLGATNRSINKQPSSGKSAKKSATKSALDSDKDVKTATNSPQVYKSVHNIGRRKATERVISYKETEIAVCFKDSYWPNARLDLGGLSRSESTRAQNVHEKSSSSSTGTNEIGIKAEERLEARNKNEKIQTSMITKNTAKVTKDAVTEANSSSTSVEIVTPQIASRKKDSLGSQKSAKRKTNYSNSSKKAKRASKEAAKKDEDDEVEALLFAAASSDTADSEDEYREALHKSRLKLSSKKRAELTFLARGLSAGPSKALTQKAKNGDQQETGRARRTASLNAGAIVSLMLQKDEPITKKDHLRWNDDDTELDDSTSSSSESIDSNFSMYSATCENRQLKKSAKLSLSTCTRLRDKTSLDAAVAKPVTVNEQAHASKASHGVTLVSSGESTSIPPEMPATVEEPVTVSDEAAYSFPQKVGSHVKKTSSLTEVFISPKESISTTDETDATNSSGRRLCGTGVGIAKNTSPNLQNRDTEALEAKGKKKKVPTATLR